MRKQGAIPHPLGLDQQNHGPFNENTGSTDLQKSMPDPRIMLISVFVTGICVWQLPPYGVVVLGLLIGWAFFHWYSRLTLPPRTISRLTKFISLWVLFKIIMQYTPLLWAQKDDWLAILRDADTASSALFAKYILGNIGRGIPLFIENHSAELAQTGIFCLQLACLVLLGLLLAGGFSAYALACAFSWCLRPLRFFNNHEGWKLALALALLLNYIPRIFETLDAIRRTCLLRCLPTHGLAYWRLAIPRFFSILAEQTWSQAIAIASRKLDNAKPWDMLAPLPLLQAFLCGIYSLGLLLCLVLPALT